MKFFAFLASVSCVVTLVLRPVSKLGLSATEVGMLKDLGYKDTTVDDCLYDYIEKLCYDLAGAYEKEYENLGCDSTIVKAATNIDSKCKALRRKIHHWKNIAQNWGGGCAPSSTRTKVLW